nr:MAG TPA: hypothetical protein [Caudoviricetes sp.]
MTHYAHASTKSRRARISRPPKPSAATHDAPIRRGAALHGTMTCTGRRWTQSHATRPSSRAGTS